MFVEHVEGIEVESIIFEYIISWVTVE